MCSTGHFIYLVVLLFQVIQVFTDPEVLLPTGRIRGRSGTTLQNKTYYAFEKIPYAAPPLGPLRLKPPVPPKKWSGTLDTTDLDVTCIVKHYSRNQSEDCLYISVVTPKLSSRTPLPVLFYIFGGAFQNDSTVDYRNSDGIIENDVILVTFNYRLGPLGFLSTEDDVIPGNFGLKDQQLALEWTHQNINLFGGDPNKITIWGQSAGAMSVGYHLLHQPFTNLFWGAILDSGSALTEKAYQREARKNAFQFAAFLNKNSTFRDSNQLLKYLQSVEVEEIKEATTRFNEAISSQGFNLDINQGKAFVPVLESNGGFITEKPYQQLQKGKTAGVPILIGFNSEEKLLVLKDKSLLNELVTNLDQHPEILVPRDMKISNASHRLTVAEKIRNIYLQNKSVKSFKCNECDGVRYFSDVIYTKSIIKFAEMYSKTGRTYFYEFSYDGDLGGLDAFCPGAGRVSHTEEIKYIFCHYPSCKLTDYPESDQLTQKRLVKIWTNFAKTLNPTPEASSILENIKWPIVSTNNGDFFYVRIGNNLEVKNHPKKETYDGWVKLYQSLPTNDLETF